jgi:hypothetical protein
VTLTDLAPSPHPLSFCLPVAHGRSFIPLTMVLDPLLVVLIPAVPVHRRMLLAPAVHLLGRPSWLWAIWCCFVIPWSVSLLSSSSSPSFIRSFIVVVAAVTGPGVVSLDLAVGVNTCNPPCEQLLAGVVTGVASFVMVGGAVAVRCCCGAPRKSNCNGKKTTHTCGETGPKKMRDLLDECFGGEESVVFSHEMRFLFLFSLFFVCQAWPILTMK